MGAICQGWGGGYLTMFHHHFFKITRFFFFVFASMTRQRCQKRLERVQLRHDPLTILVLPKLPKLNKIPFLGTTKCSGFRDNHQKNGNVITVQNWFILDPNYWFRDLCPSGLNPASTTMSTPNQIHVFWLQLSFLHHIHWSLLILPVLFLPLLGEILYDVLNFRKKRQSQNTQQTTHIFFFLCSMLKIENDMRLFWTLPCDFPTLEHTVYYTSLTLPLCILIWTMDRWHWSQQLIEESKFRPIDLRCVAQVGTVYWPVIWVMEVPSFCVQWCWIQEFKSIFFADPFHKNTCPVCFVKCPSQAMFVLDPVDVVSIRYFVHSIKMLGQCTSQYHYFAWI